MVTGLKKQFIYHSFLFIFKSVVFDCAKNKFYQIGRMPIF